MYFGERAPPLTAEKRLATNPTKEHEKNFIFQLGKNLQPTKPFVLFVGFVATENQSTGIPQMSRAYSRMVRSLENLPILATLRMDLRIQFG